MNVAQRLYARSYRKCRLCDSQGKALDPYSSHLRVDLVRVHRWICWKRWIAMAWFCRGWAVGIKLSWLRMTCRTIAYKSVVRETGPGVRPHLIWVKTPPDKVAAYEALEVRGYEEERPVYYAKPYAA